MRRAAAAWVLIAALLIGGGAGRPSIPPPTERIGDLFPIMPWEIQPEKQALERAASTRPEVSVEPALGADGRKA